MPSLPATDDRRDVREGSPPNLVRVLEQLVARIRRA